MSRHTPGPWVAEYIEGTTDQFVGTQQEMVARVTGSIYDGDAHANARLIAAAPDLFELAKHLRDFAFDMTHYLDDEQGADLARRLHADACSITERLGWTGEVSA